ncbi:MAG: pyridoxamine 5'-phosphate oxidase family protein [Bacillota bacterium]
MADSPLTQLPDELVLFLQGRRLVLLVTADAGGGPANVHAVSWVLARNSREVLMAADNRSRLAINLRADGRVVLVVPGAGGCWSISGTARLEEETMPDTPLRLARFRLEVEAVRDVMFFGARLAAAPEYDVTYNAEAAARLDDQVYAALRR